MSQLRFASALFVAAFVWGSPPAAAQTAKAKVIEALNGSANGKCIEAIMSPLLLDACEQQIDANRRILSPLGKILDARYLGIQEMGNGMKAEAYRVDFQRGEMMWLASLDSEGRLLVFWSSGQVRPK